MHHLKLADEAEKELYNCGALDCFMEGLQVVSVSVDVNTAL